MLKGTIAMVHEQSPPATVNAFALPVGVGLLAVVIFAVDVLARLPDAVAALYVVVVLLSVNFLQWRGVLLVSLGCAALAVLGYLLQHGLSHAGDPLVRLLVSLSAIGTTAFLALKNQSVADVAYEQARLLDLTHDTIFVRDMNDVITYWNQGAELSYGWSKVEAIGQVSHQLTHTVFPAPLEDVNAELHRTGRWEGELVHTRADGAQVVVASRWSLQRDDQHRPLAILETNNDITDRKRATEALRRSEAYLAEAQKLSHTGSFGWSVATGDVIWSDETFRIFGYDKAPCVTIDMVVQRAHPDDRAHVQQTIDRAVRDGKDFDFEHRLLMPGGSTKHVHVVAHAVHDASGGVEFVGAVMDITEQHQARAALEEAFAEIKKSEDHLRLVIDTIPSMVWSCGPDGGIDFVSQSSVEYYGLSLENPHRPRLESVLHPDDVARRVEEFSAALAAGKPFEHEFRARRADGEYRWLLSRAVPLRDDLGNIVRWYGAATDIHERKRAEDALRESEQRFRDYAETASDWLWETGPDHRFTRLSQQLADVGISPALRMGLRRWDFATDVDQEPEKWRLHLATLEAHRPFRGFVFRVAADDNSTHYISASGKPVFDPEGCFLGYRGVGSDVTAAVRAEQAEEALHKTQMELAHVARVTTLGELTASIAHEVNQPLAAIVTNGEVCLRWLDREVPDLAEVREGVGDIISNGRRASEIVRRLRALSERSETQKAALDINDAISEVIPLLQQEVLSHRVSLRLELAPTLPAVLGDRVQLQQVIINLIVNGMEAMAPVTERSRELVVRSRLDDSGEVLVAVEDSGVGIDPDNAKQLFNAFFTTKPGGMGMGLSICRSIVENHGGRLWASRNAGPGATFQFALQSQPEARP